MLLEFFNIETFCCCWKKYLDDHNFQANAKTPPSKSNLLAKGKKNTWKVLKIVIGFTKAKSVIRLIRLDLIDKLRFSGIMSWSKSYKKLEMIRKCVWWLWRRMEEEELSNRNIWVFSEFFKLQNSQMENEIKRIREMNFFSGNQNKRH